jgi:hypothetical protein
MCKAYGNRQEATQRKHQRIRRGNCNAIREDDHGDVKQYKAGEGEPSLVCAGQESTGVRTSRGFRKVIHFVGAGVV